MGDLSGLGFATKSNYEIRVEGCLNSSQLDRMGDAEIRMESLPDGAPVTRLTCRRVDQAELSGVLNLLFDLGLPLLSVRYLGTDYPAA